MKKIGIFIFILILVIILVANNHREYENTIEKINNMRKTEQVKQNDEGMKEADHLKELITSQNNYDKQLIISIFLPLLVLVLSDISRDMSERKQDENLQKKMLYILKNKVYLNFKIINNNSDLSTLQKTNYIKETQEAILEYYKSTGVVLNAKQLQLFESILNKFSLLICDYDRDTAENLQKMLNDFLDSEQQFER